MAKLEVLPKRVDVLEVNNPESVFRINIDILNEAFGVGRGMYAKAVYPDKKNSDIPGTKPGNRYIIWMPKLYGNSSEQKNVVSEDGTEIYEVAEGSRTEDWIDEDSDLDVLRLVFVKDSAQSPYRFVGVFKSGKMEFCKHTYCRIASKVKIIGNPVTKIELLDDNRQFVRLGRMFPSLFLRFLSWCF